MNIDFNTLVNMWVWLFDIQKNRRENSRNCVYFYSYLLNFFFIYNIISRWHFSVSFTSIRLISMRMNNLIQCQDTNKHFMEIQIIIMHEQEFRNRKYCTVACVFFSKRRRRFRVENENRIYSHFYADFWTDNRQQWWQ